MDFEEFYPLSQEDFDSIVAEKTRGISKYEMNPIQRHQLSNLKKIMDVGGINETIYYRGYIDVHDVWTTDQGLFLRHRVLDSTD